MDIIVLTKHYQYWCEADLRKVLTWLVLDKIEVVESHAQRFVRRLNIAAPLIVRLVHFAGYRAKSEVIPFNDNAVYDRDDSVCQYWHYDDDGRRFRYRCSAHERTIDHVVPRSLGGHSSFDNCVCACRRCNIGIKRNRALSECGLELVRKPSVPRRRKGELVRHAFVYNPFKLSHRIYRERVLGQRVHETAPQPVEAMAAR
jgi:5-methylcytosine-specific restriction endonuclease McrA